MGRWSARAGTAGWSVASSGHGNRHAQTGTASEWEQPHGCASKLRPHSPDPVPLAPRAAAEGSGSNTSRVAPCPELPGPVRPNPGSRRGGCRHHLPTRGSERTRGTQGHPVSGQPICTRCVGVQASAPSPHDNSYNQELCGLRPGFPGLSVGRLR